MIAEGFPEKRSEYLNFSDLALNTCYGVAASSEQSLLCLEEALKCGDQFWKKQQQFQAFIIHALESREVDYEVLQNKGYRVQSVLAPLLVALVASVLTGNPIAHFHNGSGIGWDWGVLDDDDYYC